MTDTLKDRVLQCHWGADMPDRSDPLRFSVPTPSASRRISFTVIVLGVVLAGMAFALWGLHKSRAISRAHAAIDTLNCRAFYEEEMICPPWLHRLVGGSIADYLGTSRRLAALNVGVDVGDEILPHVRHLKGLRRLSLLHSQVTDEGLSHLRGCTNLTKLNLTRTRVTDTGLAHLRKLKRLKSLYLFLTQVSDVGLEHVAGLTSLETLDLDATHISDAGLAHLKQLTNLKSLSLAGTQITDDGLQHLYGLKKLEYLDVSYNAVSSQGLKALRQALPNATIYSLARKPEPN